MLAYVIRRVFAGVIMLIVMSLVTFMLFFASPVDPARLTCGKNCSPTIIKQNRKALGYDQPSGDAPALVKGVVQWEQFLVGVVKGREFPLDKALRDAAPNLVTNCPAPCLGYSPKSNELVTTLIKERFPVSFSLGIAAGVMWIVGGVALGAIAALRKGKISDRIIVGATLVAFAFPTFFVGRFLYKFVALKWQLVPLPVYSDIATYGVGQWLIGLLLPALTLALFYMASYVRMTRAFVLETLSEDYLRTAKAKGVKPFTILRKHTMRAALTPLVTMAGLDLSSVIGGAIITESVFNYQGLGQLAAKAARDYDLPVTVGIVLVLAALVIVANIVVDILYAFIDPRVRVG